MRVLHKNMNGDDVKQWQNFLNQEGFSVGTADGVFGEQTHQATIAFQNKHGLTADGVVGAGTLSHADNLNFNSTNDSSDAKTDASTGLMGEEELMQVMPSLSSSKCQKCLPFLQKAMDEFDINTPERAAAFIAQLAHESGELKFMEEIWGPTAAQRRYEPTTSLSRQLGNMDTGDGFRYKGRGPIQITGCFNYKKYGDMLGVNLVDDPPLAANPEVAFRIAALYWRSNGLNECADQMAFRTITKRINGGFNGLDERLRYYGIAKTAFGISGTRGESVEDTGDDSALPVFTRGSEFVGEKSAGSGE